MQSPKNFKPAYRPEAIVRIVLRSVFVTAIFAAGAVWLYLARLERLAANEPSTGAGTRRIAAGMAFAVWLLIYGRLHSLVARRLESRFGAHLSIGVVCAAIASLAGGVLLVDESIPYITELAYTFGFGTLTAAMEMIIELLTRTAMFVRRRWMDFRKNELPSATEAERRAAEELETFRAAVAAPFKAQDFQAQNFQAQNFQAQAFQGAGEVDHYAAE